MKALKIILFVLTILVIVIFVLFKGLDRKMQQISVSVDMSAYNNDSLLKKGKYLAHHVYVCLDCHSGRDWSKFSGPLVEGTLGQGGEKFLKEHGFPGDYYSPNITPYGLKDWTDNEIITAITAGVSKNGSPIFPIMPYLHYGQADKDDIVAIMAYIKSLDPKEVTQPASKPVLPMKFILRTIPKEPNFTSKPDVSNTVEHGKYLSKVSGCYDCHTPQEKGQYLHTEAFTGGFKFPFPGGDVISSNITPHSETGIGDWTEKEFVERFRKFDPDSNQLTTVKEDEFNTPMPWSMYAKMKDEDLKAIFAYLQSLEPKENAITKFKPHNQE